MGSEATCIIRYLVKHMLASSPNTCREKQKGNSKTYIHKKKHQTDRMLNVDYVTW